MWRAVKKTTVVKAYWLHHSVALDRCVVLTSDMLVRQLSIQTYIDGKADKEDCLCDSAVIFLSAVSGIFPTNRVTCCVSKRNLLAQTILELHH